MTIFIKKHLNLVVLSLFIVIGVTIYANSLNNTFLWDDNDSIVNNSYIQNWDNIPKFFTENLISGSGQITDYWRPVLLVSFALDYQFWELNPFGFHLTSTLMHIFVAWLAYICLRKIVHIHTPKEDLFIGEFSFFKDILPLISALLFLIHPINTESITYIAGRADPLSSIFTFISIISYLNYRQKNNPPFLNYQHGGYLYISSLIFFIFGLMTKEQVILLPLLITALEFIIIQKKINREIILKITALILPFFITSIIYLSMRLTILDFNDMLSGFTQNSSYDSSVLQRLLTFAYVILIYFKILFIPTGLHMAREIELITSIFSLKILTFFLSTGAIIQLCKNTWRNNRLITMGFAWFFIILLPRTNIFQINRPMYEHWLYLPMIGFWLATISAIFLIIKNKKTIKIFLLLVAGLLFTFGILTIKRNNDWENPITFYEKNLKYTPNSFIQHNNLGMAYADNNKHRKAIDEYTTSLSIKDVYPQVHSNLANSLLATGHTAEAINEYNKAIKMSPNFIIPYYKLIDIYIMQKNYNKFNETINKMDVIFATNDNYQYSKGIIFFNLKNYTKAIETWKNLAKKTNNTEIKKLIQEAYYQKKLHETK